MESQLFSNFDLGIPGIKNGINVGKEKLPMRPFLMSQLYLPDSDESESIYLPSF